MLINKILYKHCLLLIIAVWLIYACLYIFLARSGSPVAGYLAFIGQSGLDICAAILMLYLMKRVKEVDSRIICLFFFISFFAGGMADGIYNLGMNVMVIKYFSSINSLFEIPFVVFLLFQVIGWATIFFRKEDFSAPTSKFLYLPYGVIAALIFIIFIFGINWKISYFSLFGIYQIIDTILEVLGFTIATICLARAKNTAMHFSSMGYLIIISSDILIRYDVVLEKTPYLNYFESTWVFGLLLMIVGFYNLRKENILLLPLNSLQSNIAIRILNICLLFVTLFVVSTHILSDDQNHLFHQLDVNLLAILVPLSILAIIASKYLSSRISTPLERFENIIRKFSSEEDLILNRNNEILKDSIFEFAVMEDFIYDAFSIHQKNRLIEKELANVSAQVAHDI